MVLEHDSYSEYSNGLKKFFLILIFWSLDEPTILTISET